MEFEIKKYPRTQHIQGSRLQAGDEDLTQIPFASVAGQRIIVEEKVDGANTAVSFDAHGQMLLQSRGHYLTGGPRERHYQLFKTWAQVHASALYEVLGCRYVMYGEWLYAKHTVFYDALPHYFLEFDILDRESGRFLDTPSRRALLGGLPVVSVPVLADASFRTQAELTSLIGQSNYITKDHIDHLRAYCIKNALNAERAVQETCPTTLMEGLYIKLERNGCVEKRMKFVRRGFLQCMDQSETHWLDRPLIPNQLRVPLDTLFLPAPPCPPEEA